MYATQEGSLTATERKGLLGTGEREALIAKLGGIYRPNVDWSTAMIHPGFVGGFAPGQRAGAAG